MAQHTHNFLLSAFRLRTELDVWGRVRAYRLDKVRSPRSDGVLFLRPHRCVCNIDCSHTNFNPVCASDGRSYDNPCQVKEASCQHLLDSVTR